MMQEAEIAIEINAGVQIKDRQATILVLGGFIVHMAEFIFAEGDLSSGRDIKGRPDQRQFNTRLGMDAIADGELGRVSRGVFNGEVSRFAEDEIMQTAP